VPQPRGTRSVRPSRQPLPVTQIARVPFGEALWALLDERGMSLRQLEAATRNVDPERKGLTNSFLSQAANGRTKISAGAIWKVAAALGVEPCYFAEYRAAVVRRAFDPDVVSFQALLTHLDDLDALIRSDRSKDRSLRTMVGAELKCASFQLRDAGAGVGLGKLAAALKADATGADAVRSDR
jgi:transcriptional regulator with XRE-family HTH domain